MTGKQQRLFAAVALGTGVFSILVGLLILCIRHPQYIEFVLIIGIPCLTGMVSVLWLMADDLSNL